MKHFILIFACLCSFANAVFSNDDLLYFTDLYQDRMEYSDKLRSLNGKKVRFTGYMAPPLKVESKFFVLTKMPQAICPFCEDDAEWPDDLIFVTGQEIFKHFAFNRKIITTGILELGTKTHQETGFVSRVRIVDAKVELYD